MICISNDPNTASRIKNYVVTTAHSIFSNLYGSIRSKYWARDPPHYHLCHLVIFFFLHLFPNLLKGFSCTGDIMVFLAPSCFFFFDYKEVSKLNCTPKSSKYPPILLYEHHLLKFLIMLKASIQKSKYDCLSYKFSDWNESP